MANTYSWTIQKLYYDLGPDAEGHSDIVTSIDWLVTASDGEDPAHEALWSRVQHIVWEEGDPWIDYSDLEESDVVDWVQDAVGEDYIADMQSGLDAEIAEKETPTHGSSSDMPWDEDDGA